MRKNKHRPKPALKAGRREPKRKPTSKHLKTQRPNSDLSREVGEVSSGLKELHATAERTHHKISALHESIDVVHGQANMLHQRPPPLLVADTVEIVTDDQRSEKGKPFPIVGIGASAGGYEAFSDFLKALPDDTGMAYVLVQHLDPKHESKLTQLLARSSKLPVLEAAHGMDVEPNHIYVIPENTDLKISAGRLGLSPRRAQEMPPMPIDSFFRSLADHQQERAIGVVLSGTGSDGTLGLEAIKGQGGLAFAQDENSSKYFGMPGNAIASGSVDFILPPAEIARELRRVARHPYLQRPVLPQPKPVSELEAQLLRENPGEMTTLFAILRRRTGVDFAGYKQSTLKRRIFRRMVLNKSTSLPSYIRMAEAQPAELDALFNDLLIGVTNFFRDPLVFQALKRKVFPRILKAHPGDTPLRFWACGCASGEEAYSLAISLVEFLEQNYAHRSAQIFGTDVSEASIEKARAGLYPESILQDVSPEILRRFFIKANGNYQVSKVIRDMCIFARQNVLVDPPFSNLDLVTCRNVLIYFGAPLQRRIIPMFHYALRSTGFLLLGNAETIGASTEQFSAVDKKNKIYLKKTSYQRSGFEPGRRPPDPQPRDAASLGERASALEARPLDLQQQVDRLLLREFSPAAVVVNSDFDVIQFRGQTGDYLEHAPGQATLNLLKMAREGLVMSLRALLNRAAKSDAPAKQSGLELSYARQVRTITIEVVPFKLAAAQEHCFLVVFRESEGPSPAELERQLKKEGVTKAVRERREMLKLRQELGATKESLQSIIEEQEATNEELKSANEEIQSSNEELQSTNEELETAKEELQSTNEELTTLNEELQNRNAEMTQANNDLTNLVASVNVAILMLGNDLTIRRFTPMAERLFNLIPADVGRRLSDLTRGILVPDLDDSVHQVIENLTPVEREAQDRDGHWFMLRIRPYRTRENKIEGAVILLVDIDELRRTIDAVLETAKEPLLVLGGDLKVRKANESFFATFQLQPSEVEGKLLFELGDGWNAPNLRNLLEEVLPKNKQIQDLELEATFPKVGWRRLALNARRFFAQGRGAELILLAFEDLTNKA